ncbi:DNA polymerase IV [bacterium]|nr:DNA polymerase IV [bacterium]
MAEIQNHTTRKIIHIDMDAFFASIEQRDFPHLKGKPVVVGKDSERGVIAAASYEARKFGVKSAMPSKLALLKCPHLIFQASRFDAYKEASKNIMSIFNDYSDLVEPLSLDEAFIDVSVNKLNQKSATIIAQEIRERIKKEVNLTASAGISVNKFLAKIASDQNKPNGLFVIHPHEVNDFMNNLHVLDFFGVGKKTKEVMHKLGIFTGRDMKKVSLNKLTQYFGKRGLFFYNICRGIDERPVIPNRKRKSVGTENTFAFDLFEKEEIEKEINQLIPELWKRIEKNNSFGKTVTLKIKYKDFTQITRSKTHTDLIQNKETLQALVTDITKETVFQKPIRLLGITVSNLLDNISFTPIQMIIPFE